ncbi:hypothetical protein [Bradyrhizobium sp. 2S1]|uniref:hypothetical protein n=1 Tax=Bradyrhizobium sp. 2S1 TaxID=1404429 RepID=UPI00140CEA9F|nr:hypothetical protein [Bradyrhizobium sp. 2S1]MCK7670874.1 hypothetical protein [Bradyrhizobium sp. 2S1]
MTEMNGVQHDPSEETAELMQRDLERLAARADEPSIRVQELVKAKIQPFDQQSHDQMIKSVDQLATDWVSQLEHSRQNNKAVEQLVLERAAKLRHDITVLHVLGAAARAEAARGDEVNSKLAQEIDKLGEDRAA